MVRESGKQSHRFRGGPDPDDLRRWVSEGKSDAEIGVLVGDINGTEPATRQAVAYWRRTNGIPSARSRAVALDHSDIRPWPVRAQHVGDPIEHRLYDYGRRLKGAEPFNPHLLDEFLATLKRHDLVVDYNPDTEEGWVFRHRDPKVDDPGSIIRRPS